MKKLVFLIVFVLLITTTTSSYYFYHKYKEFQTNNAQQQPKNELDDLVEKVGKHILLPPNETPTIMTVADREKLSGQQFFANAINGDKVLIFETAKKAFLYNPTTDRIIEVGPVTFDTPKTASVSASE